MPNPLSSPADSEERTSVAESRIVAGLILLTLFLSGLPYLLGYYIVPLGMHFVGAAYNIDDYCNYLSWLRQTMDGHFFLRDLFTTEPQKGLEFNVFFWLLGRLAHLLHLSPQAALQAARIGGSLALLALIYRFYRFVLPADVPARLTAFGFACLGSGFGWVRWAHWHDKNLPGSPVDARQPEAFTFLTLYTSALMTVSTLLILGALYALLLGEQSGKWRYPAIAGICGAILGNMHSYDVLHLSAAWGLFLVVWTVLRRGRGVALSWARALLALGLTLPTTIYQYLVFRNEAVFHQRANVLTLSPSLWHYVLGYGLVFLLAVITTLGILFPLCVTHWLRRSMNAKPAFNEAQQQEVESTAETILKQSQSLLFVICWAIAGLLIVYLPVAFQRKMLMGEHIPLSLLAGWASGLVVNSDVMFRAWRSKEKTFPREQFRTRPYALALLVLLAAPSNILFLVRDVSHVVSDRSETHQVPFLSDSLIATFHWLAANTPPNAAIIGHPLLCAYLPGYADRAVWAGHWGETPHYGEKFQEYNHFAERQTPDAERRQFLQSTKAQYLLYPNDVSGGAVTTGQSQVVDLVHGTPAYLLPVYRNKDYTLFRINLGG